MSATPQVAVLGGGRLRPRAPGRTRTFTAPDLTAVAFTLLAAYGILRWDTMLPAGMLGRLAGMLALSLVIVLCAGPARSQDVRIRSAAVAAIVIAAVGMIPMAGFPLSWALHLRFAVTIRAIAHGLSALPGVLVPYAGAERSIRGVIALGAGMLMLGSSLTLASSRRPLGELRLAGAALPLVVLAVVPSALSRPTAAYLQGAALFGLLALFVFSERLSRRRARGATAFLAIAALGALVVAPRVDSHQPWVSFVRLSGPGVGAGISETFDWSQTYGPLVWPTSGNTVLDVHARFPAYWKAADFDEFDGRGWVSAAPGTGGGAEGQFAGVTRANLSRWEQPLAVTVRGMDTTAVIAAGTAGTPAIDSRLQSGSTFGTWATTSPLRSGSRYQVQVYTPEPSISELARAGHTYPVDVAANDLTISLPAKAAAAAPSIKFAPYGTGTGPRVAGGSLAGPAQDIAVLRASPYAPVYRLAVRLETGTHTPYEFVQAVDHYLATRFTYDQTPPAGRYPILDFLFGDRLGYCQQFAGAMALLLRIGGVPARVAAGFTTGAYDRSTREYVVSDRDAHAWVEAWFPGYGWITFDPTPAAHGGAGGVVTTSSSESFPNQRAAQAAHTHHGGGAAPAGGHPRSRASSGSHSSLLILAALLVLALVGSLALAVARPRGRPRRGSPAEVLLGELETAFARCRRPLPDGATLVQIEQRFAGNADAEEYVARLRRARFAGTDQLPTGTQRRAVRACLRDGLGVWGRLRAIVAMPPWRALH